MRRARFSLEEQVGGLLERERYHIRRSPRRALPQVPDRTADARRPVEIRASRAA